MERKKKQILKFNFIGDARYNRDRPEIFQNSLIERTPKAALPALNLSTSKTKKLRIFN